MLDRIAALLDEVARCVSGWLAGTAPEGASGPHPAGVERPFETLAVALAGLALLRLAAATVTRPGQPVGPRRRRRPRVSVERRCRPSRPGTVPARAAATVALLVGLTGRADVDPGFAALAPAAPAPPAPGPDTPVVLPPHHGTEPDAGPAVRPAPPPASAPAPTRSGEPPPVPSAAGPVHVVEPGDCLWDIVAARLGPDATAAAIDRGWRLLYAANRAVIGDDPHLIFPGQRLTLVPLT